MAIFASAVNATANDCAGAYTVKPGDTLTSIATTCSVTVDAILAANPTISPNDPLPADISLVIPGGTVPDEDIIPDTGGDSPPEAGDTTTHVVQQGDTLESIAAQYGTTVSALLLANPVLSDGSPIVPGQVLRIPGVALPNTGGGGEPVVDVLLPTVWISPQAGLAGTVVDVEGAGFPASSAVNVSLGLQGAPQVTLGTVPTGPDGRFIARVLIPSFSQPGQVWVVAANTLGGGVQQFSNPFTVTAAPPPGDGTGGGGEIVLPDTGGAAPRTHVVEQGETLSSIAKCYEVPLSAVIQANPQISDLARIYPGQVVVIP